jgi:peptidylprolyl isomerase
MTIRLLFAVPFAALLIAAAPAPVPAPAPSIAPPADVAANPANHLFLDLSNGGTVEIVLRPDLAPHHIERIQTLVRQGFYNGLTFHRVVPGFMAQGGDPTGTGSGGPGYRINFEQSPLKHIKGALGMARTQDPNSAGSQFYITLEATPHLDGGYVVFGQVVEGMDVVSSIKQGDVIQSVDIQ